MKSFLPEHIKCAAVISPAGTPDAEELRKGIELLQSCGIKVKIMPHAFGSSTAHPKYLAASDEERAADLMQAYCDPDVDIIFAARGGYGCGRILPLLDWKKLRSAGNKIVAGYSDLTSLFFAMTSKECGTPLASVMAAKLAECSSRELDAIRSACSKEKRVFGLEVIKPGNSTGELLAGNLTVAVSCIGTQYMPDVRGKILLLEDVGEDIYRLDRMFNQLKLSNILQSCSGIIAGYFSGCQSDDVRNLLKDYSQYVNAPVLSGFSYGHELPFDAVLYGTRAEINDSRLTVNP